MGADNIYTDGKAQPMSTTGKEQKKRKMFSFLFYSLKYVRIESPTNKRCASPIDKDEKIEYLIRGELDRDHSALIKRDGIIFIK